MCGLDWEPSAETTQVFSRSRTEGGTQTRIILGSVHSGFPRPTQPE
jgi:hypothetical protein